jgi:hypothetical protein
MTVLTNLSLNSSTAGENKDGKEKNGAKLTTSETQRNIGSVTFFLDPKQFEENFKNKSHSTAEMWLPIRDITVAPNVKLSVSLFKVN